MQLSCLGTLPSGLIGELLEVGERIDHPPGSTIYREGDEPRTLLVVRGLLRVYLASPEGRQVTVRYARDSDVLGIAVLVGGPADVGVQTLADCTLFRIDSRVLTAAARSDARVAWALAEELNRRLYAALQQAAINAFGSVRQRVAAHLLDLASAAATLWRTRRAGIPAGTGRRGRFSPRSRGEGAAGLPRSRAGRYRDRHRPDP